VISRSQFLGIVITLCLLAKYDEVPIVLIPLESITRYHFFYWDVTDWIHSTLQDQIDRDGIFTMVEPNATTILHDAGSLNR